MNIPTAPAPFTQALHFPTYFYLSGSSTNFKIRTQIVINAGAAQLKLTVGGSTFFQNLYFSCLYINSGILQTNGAYVDIGDFEGTAAPLPSIPLDTYLKT